MYENLANILSLIFRLVGVLNEKKKKILASWVQLHTSRKLIESFIYKYNLNITSLPFPASLNRLGNCALFLHIYPCHPVLMFLCHFVV